LAGWQSIRRDHDCSLASGLNAWINKTLQPQAKAMLGKQVVKLHNATSYSCRNRYGGESTPLSEHALANAIDISEFVFESGEMVTVLASWPRTVTALPVPPGRAEPHTVAAETTGPITPAPRDLSRRSSDHGQGERRDDPSPYRPNPRLSFVVPGCGQSAAAALPAGAVAPGIQSRTELKGEFVKIVRRPRHTFGTVLGPSQRAKDHFHFDMKARRRAAICE
jgi:hypothetical protein